MKWYRFYNEVVHDSKVQRLPGELYRTWTNLLCIASEHDPRGTLPELCQIAFLLRMSESKVKQALTALETAGLFDRDESGTLRPHNWDIRQPESDDAAARMRQSRRRRIPNANPTDNGHVTGGVTERVAQPVQDDVRKMFGPDSEEIEIQSPPFTPPSSGGAVAAAAEIAPLPPGYEQAITEARDRFGENAAALVAAKARTIDAQLGGRFDVFLDALDAASHHEPPLKHVFPWCMTRAKARINEPHRPAFATSRPGDRGAPPPPPGKAESAGCELCSGEGQVTVWHPDPKAARQPASTSADCSCPRGRAMRASRKAVDNRRIVDLADVLEGRSVWLREQPEESRA